jgi:hypothetical protein
VIPGTEFSRRRVVRLETFDGTPAWYMRCAPAQRADGSEGRLVSMFR